jgi:hypothetical protein
MIWRFEHLRQPFAAVIKAKTAAEALRVLAERLPNAFQSYAERPECWRVSLTKPIS